MSPQLLPDLLSRSADLYPDHPAIEMEGRALTYAELEAASNQVAHTLIDHDVKRGDRVALWLPKSPESISALYGIMKAGAAYVAVDPSAPPQRLAFIARDCAIVALVTHSSRAAILDSEFAGDAPMRVTLFGDNGSRPRALAGRPTVGGVELSSVKSTRPESRVQSEDLAYILYTSGSTGQPKGVMISHRASLSFVEWATNTFQIDHHDRLANHAGFHFDLSTFDLYAGARAGATVFPVSGKVTAFPAALANSWAQQRLTVWYATPSTMIQLLSHGALANHDLTSLRVVLFAGEVFPVKHLRELMKLAPQARFANLYGPTETNVCTWYEVEELPKDDSPLPIGRICPNCEGHILDESQNPVAEGDTGELWIGGGTLMHGYWGRPELTARRLREIPTPNGNRMLAYNTGDLVARRPDGILTYLGRRDHQIKTRGYRVELGEIEAVLCRHPDVNEAVLLPIPDDEVGHRLQAVVVPRPAVTIDPADLKRHCAEFLPRYMVPERIDFKPNLPRTASDKIDREALLKISLSG